MTHTPGPWAVGKLDRANNAPINAVGEVCALVSVVFNADVYDGNARLIAAAPELLAACELLMRDPPGWSTVQQSDAYEGIAAAIAKARGQ